MIRPLNIIWNEHIKRLNIYLNEENPLGDLTLNSYEYLCGIYDNPGCTTTELALALGRKKPSVSTMVDSLINKGYVVRKDCEDKRSHKLSLCDVAHLLVHNEYEFYNNYIGSLAAYISPDEATTLGKILDKIVKGINNEKT